MKLELTDSKGQILRTFAVDGERARVIRRRDTGRVEIHLALDTLNREKVSYDLLGEVDRPSLVARDFVHGSSAGGGVRLRLVAGERSPGQAAALLRDPKLQTVEKSDWPICLALVSVLAAAFIALALARKSNVASVEQDLKQQVVKIVKQIPPKTEKTPEVLAETKKDEAPKPVVEKKVKVETPKKTVNVKRLGALSVLGQLAKSQQKGGLNLNAANTTAGPGLGGNAGSGGVQKTLYGKGLVAAPVGEGANMQGAGGYGTKGKGGGQAGYGTMSLVGSAGAAPVPLGHEAVIEGGLDRDLISGVIAKNMGQVRFCYEQALQADPSLAGRVAIAFVIGANGQVKSASVDSTTVNSKQVEECIVLRLRSWRFPLPTGGVDVKVSYPFVLRRSGQA